MRREEKMTTYYFNKTLEMSFEDAIARVTEELKKEGFGVLTEVDVQATLKKAQCGFSSVSNTWGV